MPNDDPKEDKRYPAAAGEKPQKPDAKKKRSYNTKESIKPVKNTVQKPPGKDDLK